MRASTEMVLKSLSERFQLLESHVRGNFHAWFGGE